MKKHLPFNFYCLGLCKPYQEFYKVYKSMTDSILRVFLRYQCRDLYGVIFVQVLCIVKDRKFFQEAVVNLIWRPNQHLRR
jgi:hypothetical protein